jgi:hypothetical protein
VRKNRQKREFDVEVLVLRWLCALMAAIATQGEEEDVQLKGRQKSVLNQ